MADLSIRLFGPFQVALAGEPVTDFASDKTRALLAYLVAEADRHHRREALAGLLWPDYPEKSARTSLRSALANLRQVIGDRDADPSFLNISRKAVQFNREGDVWSDVAAFAEGMKSGLSPDRPGDQQDFGRLEDVVALYRGGFLEGFSLSDSAAFEEWALLKREQFQRQALTALQNLVDHHEACGNVQRALEHAWRQVEMDPWRDATQSQLMRLLALSGQRCAALSQYQAYRQLLATELGVEPSDEVQETFELLLKGEPPTGSPIALRAGEREPRVVGACPYRGLAAFREADAPFFFGREVFTERLYEAVQGRLQVAVIVGSSGSGKSSAVFAGLLPRLRETPPRLRGTLPRLGGTAPHLRGTPPPLSSDGQWLIADFRPGTRPFHALAAALLPILEPELGETDRLIETCKLAKALSEGDVHLCDVVERVLEKSVGTRRVLLLVDQFEELYTLCPEPETHRRFLDVLLMAVEPGATQRESPIVLLLTLRADFMGQALGHRPLADALQEASLILGPMTRDELRVAIEKPAEKQGAAFEAGLVERLLDDVGEEPGKLPLLAFALTLMWARLDRGWMAHAAYEEIGRVEGALARYAEGVFGELKEEEREGVRRIFVQLVQPGEGTEDTRRVATRAEFGDEYWGLVQHLADRRLVVTGRDVAGQEIVEVVHEALIQRWGRLQRWMQADRTFRTWQERLRFALRGWEASDQDEGALLRGAPLAEAEGWLAERGAELGGAERSFVQAGVALRERSQVERERRRQRAILALAGGLVIALALALLAGQQWQRAERQARLATARELAAAAANNLELDPERSILLALHAVSTTYAEDQTVLPEAETVLHQAVSASHLLFTLRPEELAPAWVFDVAFSPDGTRLATAHRLGRRAIIWDAVTGQDLLTLNAGLNVLGVAFSPDGTRVATSITGQGNGAVIWDAATGQRLLRLTGHAGWVLGVDFSPDGTRLATAGPDRTANVWDTADGQQLFALDGHTGFLWGVVFSPDGTRLATSSHDGSAKLWDAVSGEELLTLSGHTAAVYGVAFSPECVSPPDGGPERCGTRLATASEDGTARVWDVESGQQLLSLSGHTNRVWDIAFSLDGTRLATGSADGTAKVWDLNTGKELLSLAGHTDHIFALDFSPDGTRLATGSRDSTAKVWDIAPDGELLSFASGTVYDMALSPDGKRLATSSAAGTATVWDAVTGEQMRTVSDASHTEPTSVTEITLDANLVAPGVAFSPDGTRLATAGLDNTAKIWDLATGQLLLTIHGHSSLVNAVAFSRDGARLATASEDNTARIWDAVTGEKMLMPFGIGASVKHVVFSPDGTLLATSSTADRIRIWDTATGRSLYTLLGHGPEFTHAAFSPDGAHLAAATSAGTVKVWDLATGSERLTLTGHTKRVNSVTYSRDGTRLATAGTDGTARMWDAGTGELLLTILVHPAGVGRAVFSHDGKRLITASYDKTVRVHVLPIEELMELARSRVTRSLTDEECRQYLHVDECPPMP